MDPIPKRREIIDYLPNGKAVCYDHHRRICYSCCVDYTFDEDDDSDKQGNHALVDHDDDGGERRNHDPVNDDQVFVLWGSTARFLPQSDEEIVGPGAKFRKDWQARTSTITRPTYHFCESCGLTWLVGEKGTSAARSHPSHHTLFHEYAGTRRSLVVWLDGACLGNGSSDARAGIGGYFGSDSRYNISEALPSPPEGRATSQKAELTAAARTLRTVRSQVVPARQTLCAAAGGDRDAMHFRLVAVTDSSYLVECMCEHLPNWTENAATGVLESKKGKAIANSVEFMEVIGEVKELAKVGVQVAWYHVRREENVHADRLARRMIPTVA